MKGVHIQTAAYVGSEKFPKGEIPDGAWGTMFDVPCPRFGRMDKLSRLGLMAVELLGMKFDQGDEVGVCMETRLGSLATDRQFLSTLSPSVFTYTLPSTTIGEICIRHRLRGPVLCLVTSTGDGRQALEQAQSWMETGEAKSCLCLCADAPDDTTAITQAGALYLTQGTAILAKNSSLYDLCRELYMDRDSKI